MASNYDFRVLINTVSGSNFSYGTASLVSVQPNTSLVVNTNTMVDKINTMKQINVFNGKTHTTASSLFKSFDIGTPTFFSGSTGVDTNYQYLSASIKGNSESGSILFHANDTPTAGGDFIKRYKFFGNKVCNVLGVPENYWIYADKFRLTNTGSEQNYISGDVLAQSLHLKDNFAISNAGAIESDLPMKHAKDTDRWLKWTDVSSSIPQNDMLIGYSNQSDEYMIRMQNNKNLIISSSAITASGDFKVEGDTQVNGNITTSGIISSSTTIASNIYNSNGVGILTHDIFSDTTIFGNTQKASQINGTNIKFTAPITASGNISGSSTTTASFGNLEINGAGEALLEVQGNVSASGDIHLGKSLHINTGLNTSEANNHIVINNKINDENGILFISQSTPYVESVTNALRIGFSTAGSNNNFFIYDHLQLKTILNYNRDNGFIQINNGESNVTALNSKVVIGNSATADALDETPSEILTVSGNVSASGQFLGILPAYHTIGANIGGVAPRFLAFGPQGSSFDEEDILNEQDNRIVAAFDGYVHSVMLKASENSVGDGSSPGNTTLEFFKVGSGTHADRIYSGLDLDTTPNSTTNRVGSAVSQTMGVNTSHRFSFGSSYSFSAGDALAFKFDPTSDAGDLDGVLILMYTVTQ